MSTGSLTTSPAPGGLGASLRERTGFWLSLGGILVVVGAAATAIAVTEYHPPWSSAWFIAGVTIGALRCLSAVWALAIYLARKMMHHYLCPDPRAHSARGRQSLGSATRGSSITSAGAGAGAESAGEARWGAHLRSVLREVSADLRQAAAAIEKALEDNSYARTGDQLKVGERLRENLPVLAGLTNGDPYDGVRSAYAHIDRIRQIIQGSPAKPGAARPYPSHDLAVALRAVLSAEAAVNEELAS